MIPPVSMPDYVSELEVFLHQQYSQGQESSQGLFTLDRQRAVEIISRCQLPGSEFWILKFIQAASILRVKSLDIRQTKTENTIRIYGKNWPIQDFEQVFFNVAETGSGAIDNLRLALWSLGIGQSRAFQLTFPNSDRSYLWDGAKMTIRKSLKLAYLHVTVSHRTRKSGQIFSVLSPLRAASINTQVADLVRSRAFTAPITLRIDGLRCDGFQNSPSHGFQDLSYPLRCYGLDLNIPPLPIPPGTYENPSVPKDPNLHKLSENFSYGSLRSSQGAIAFLVGHCAWVKSGERGGYKKGSHRSTISWIRHGVIIQQDELDLPRLAISLGLFVNASHLNTDLTGFALPASQAQPLQKLACREMAAHLSLTELAIDYAEAKRDIEQGLGEGILATLGALLIGAATFIGIYSGLNPEKLIQCIQDDYLEFHKAWTSKYV